MCSEPQVDRIAFLVYRLAYHGDGVAFKMDLARFAAQRQRQKHSGILEAPS